MATTQDWTGKAVTVLGLSRSGVAVARYVASRGGQVFLSETTPASPQNEAQRQALEALGVEIEMGGHTRRVYDHADLVVLSPGIPPHSSVIETLRLSGKEIISEVEFAYRQAPDIPFIGITGTNGKSTTTTLISWILTQAGFQAPACGNIGIPVTDVLHERRPDYLVVELSSFQLTFSPTLKTKISVFTNFKPDHLDWHGSIDAYQEAKLQLFTGDQSPEWSVLLADDPVCQRAGGRTTGQVLWFSRDQRLASQYPARAYLDEAQHVALETPEDAIRLFSVDSLHLIGDHNYENVLASLSVAYLLGVEPSVIARACLQFEGLEHRLERVDTLGPRQVAFFNDSKATNTDAAISALRAFKSRKVVLIAGGYDKMTPLDDFVTAVHANAKTVVLLGQAKARFAQALEAGGYQAVEFADNLEQAVALAYRLSQGEAVLFSPACASFDMYKNFEERGRAFKAAVQALNATAGSR